MNEKEQKEAELLIKKGVNVDITSFGKKRTLHLKPPTLETLLYCNEVAVRIKDNFNEDNSIGDYLANMNEEIILKSEFIACAYLHSEWKIKLFKKIVAKWLRKILGPKDVTELVLVILNMYDLENFTPSTRLIMQSRMTKPKTTRVEPNK